MRSYHEHVDTLMKPSAPARRAPVFRSSALFPVFHDADLRTRLLFLGYWMIKRSVPELGMVVTVRDRRGSTVTRRVDSVVSARAYRVEVADLLAEAGWTGPFEGSVEIEFFSARDLAYPFPAVVVNYVGRGGSTFVHTAERVYNSAEDAGANDATQVPEGGFDVRADGERAPFVAFVNGPAAMDAQTVEARFHHPDGAVLPVRRELPALRPYETFVWWPADEFDLAGFLGDRVGTCRLRFGLRGVFPRLVVGNHDRGAAAASVTHSYYDCTDAVAARDYWHETQPGWHPAALSLPIPPGDRDTLVRFYPLLSPTELAIDVEVYSASGERLAEHRDVARIAAPSATTTTIALSALADVVPGRDVAPRTARVIARPLPGRRLPARLKIGYDVGRPGALPCNICTNLEPFQPWMDGKPGTFRWAPLLADEPRASVWFHNASPAIAYERAAEVEATFHREQDEQTITRRFVVPPNGCVVVATDADDELATFLGDRPGWVVGRSPNPYLNLFYFAESVSGLTGGDHGF